MTVAGAKGVDNLIATIDYNKQQIDGSTDDVLPLGDLRAGARKSPMVVLLCEILTFNENLEDTPELVNEDPYGSGWIIKLKVEDTTQLDALLSADAYQKLIG